MKDIKSIAILLLAACLSGIACSDYTEIHKKYVDDGETVYLRKVDKATIYSGRNRLKLQLQYTDANRLTHTMVYWNNGANFYRIDLAGAPSGRHTVEATIPDMPEGSYDLKIQNMNQFGHKSLYTDAFGTTYGDVYESSLRNRQVRSAEYLSPTECQINWMYASNQLVYTEVEYTGMEGDPIQVLPDENTVKLPIPTDWKIRYRSAFRPDATAIDLFYTDWVEKPIEKPADKEADYSQFSVLEKKYSDGVSSASCSDLAKLWNRSLAPTTANRYHLENLITHVPWSASFSMGSAQKLTRIVLWQYGWPSYGGDILYNGGNAKTYEFYGSNAPSDSGELDSSWTLFLTATIEKPSGLPRGEINALDRDVALQNGHKFTVPAETPAYQYIRMKCTAKFGEGNEWGHSTKMQVYVKFE